MSQEHRPPTNELSAEDVVDKEQSQMATSDAEDASALQRTGSAEEPSVDDALPRDEPVYQRGEALTNEEAAEIAAGRRATVVILAGTPESGKTTLLASLYDQLGRGSFGGHLFLGSRTLPGFERRHREASRGEQRSFGFGSRTSPQPPPWLHLRLRREEREEILELLLGDFPGEDFMSLVDGIQDAADNRLLWRADHIGIVVHGRQLAHPETRVSEQRDVVAILSALLESPRTIASPEALTFIVTMWDLVEASDGAAKAADETIRALEALVAKKYSDMEGEIGIIRTAARSSDIDRIPMGEGVEDLLIRWSDRPSLALSGSDLQTGD